MAVTFGAIGTTGSTTATTSVTAAYPSGISALTSKLYLVVTGRSNTANTSAAITGGGWTQVGAFEGGVGTWGVDTGTRRVEVWKKDTVTGSEAGNVTVTLAGTANNTLYARILRVEVPSGYASSEQFVSGADTTAGTGFSATASSSATFGTGDLLLIAHAGTTDTATQSAQSITASGITFGTRTNQASIASSGGNDHRHVVDTVPISTGSGTPAAPTYAYTASASTSGPVGFLVITEVAPPVIAAQPSNATVTEPATANFSVTATGATSYQWQELAPSTGGGPPNTLSVVPMTIASANPGPLSITVPTGALGCFVVFRASYGTFTLSSSFTGAFTDVTPTGGATTVRLQYAAVTGTGSQTITPDFGSFLAEGPAFFVAFVDNIDNSSVAAWVRDAVCGEVTPLSVASTVNDLVFAMDNWFSNTGAIPPNETGWTTPTGGTQNQNNIGGRLRYANSPGASTTTANEQTGAGGSFSGLAVISLIGSAGSTWTNVSTGSGGTTSSYTTAATTTALNGYQYRCIVTGPGGTTTSNAATLTVNPGGGGTTHATSGVLVGPGAAVNGAASRSRAFSSSAVIIGSGSIASGVAARNSSHNATGILIGPGSVVSGVANRTRQHDSSGVLTGPGSVVSGAATRTRSHASTGIIIGPGSDVSGSAQKTRAHSAVGVLVGSGSLVSGAASRTRAHSSSGILVGAGSAVTAAANRTRSHVSTGVLVGPGSIVSGTAAKNVSHASSGVIVGPGALVSGFADHQASGGIHASSGVIVGPGSRVAGVAARLRVHTATGVIVGPGSVVAGVAARKRAFSASGVLIGAGSLVAGSASRATTSVIHNAVGVLVGPGSLVSGQAQRVNAPVSHSSYGVLVGQGAVVTAQAQLSGFRIIIQDQRMVANPEPRSFTVKQWPRDFTAKPSRRNWSVK